MASYDVAGNTIQALPGDSVFAALELLVAKRVSGVPVVRPGRCTWPHIIQRVVNPRFVS